MALKRTAILINKITGERTRVTATTNHPSSSYNIPVWCDDDGQAIIQASGPVPAPYEVVGDSAAERLRICAQLKEARTRAGLTMVELSNRTGVSRAHLVRIEQGMYAPSIDHLAAMGRELGFTVELIEKKK